MRHRNAYLLLAAGLLAGAVMLGSSPAQESPSTSSAVSAPSAATTVAVCDIAQVFDNYLRGKELSAEFRDKSEKLRGEDDQRAKAISDLQGELEGLMEGSKEYEQRLSEVHRLTIERTTWRQFQTDQVDRDRLRLTRQMYDEILQAVSQVAKSKGVQVVLYHKRQDEKAENMTELLQQVELRKVLYAADSVDITDQVLQEVNKAFEASREK